MDENKKIAQLVTSENVEKLLDNDTKMLKKYIEDNKELCEKIKNVKKEDSDIAVRRQDAI